MAKTGAIDVTAAPVDLTEELPLDDENVLAAEQTLVWRRRRWPIVGVVVLLVAAAVGLTVWLTSGSSTPTGLSVTTVTVPVTRGRCNRLWPVRARSSRPARPTSTSPSRAR